MQKRARVPCGRALSRARLATNVDGFARYASFYIARRRFRTPCVLFTSNGGDFAHCARFYIARRRFRVLRVCFLHRPAVILRTAHAFTSHGGDFTHCARFCIVTDDFVRHAFTSHAELSHFAHSFISPADDFARRACSYTKGREKDDFKGSDF